MKKRTKFFPLEINWGAGVSNTYNICLEMASYNSNGTLAVVALEAPRGGCVTSEYFDTITVNLEFGFAHGNLAYVDTNNCPWAVEMLEENGIASPTGMYGRSGWCEYPLYEFNLEKFSE